MNKMFMRLLFLRKLSKYTSDTEGFFGRLALLLSIVPFFYGFMIGGIGVSSQFGYLDGIAFYMALVFTIVVSFLIGFVAVAIWLLFAGFLAKIINWLING